MITYLCVDKDGTEKASNYVPIRRQFNYVRIQSILGISQENILKINGINGVMVGVLMIEIFYLLQELYFLKELLKNLLVKELLGKMNQLN